MSNSHEEVELQEAFEIEERGRFKTDEEGNYGFNYPLEALRELYEELYTQRSTIDKEAIYKALRYLIWDNSVLDDLYKDIRETDAEYISVVHENDVDLAVKKECGYLKKCIMEVLNE